MSNSTILSNPIIAPNTQKRKNVLSERRSNSPNKIYRPDKYLDKFHTQMDKLWKSGGIKNGMIKNIPTRKYVIDSEEQKCKSFEK